jgi:zona occludens toxin (predicted ATPase)
MPVHEIRSISQVGTTEPFELQISRGQIPNHSLQHKFGAVPAMSINNTGTVWDINDTLYPWSSFASAGTLTVDRANAGDANKVITIVGLDADYKEISENVTLSAATGNATTSSFIRVYRAFMHNGSATNVGNIDTKKGGVTVARITAGKGQTLMGIYTVPAGYSAYLFHGTMSVQANADATGDFFIRFGGETAFRIGHSFEVTGQYFYNFAVPFKIPEKSDVDVRASVRSNNARVTAAFDMILIKEEGPL